MACFDSGEMESMRPHKGVRQMTPQILDCRVTLSCKEKRGNCRSDCNWNSHRKWHLHSDSFLLAVSLEQQCLSSRRIVRLHRKYSPSIVGSLLICLKRVKVTATPLENVRRVFSLPSLQSGELQHSVLSYLSLSPCLSLRPMCVSPSATTSVRQFANC